MASKKYRTFGDIVDGILEHGRQPLTETSTASSAPQLREKIKRLVNGRYQDLVSMQKWKWTRVTRPMKIEKKYATGTVAVTNGSKSITFTGAVLDESFKNRKIYFNNEDEIYKLISVDTGAGTAILDSVYIGTTDSDATFVIFKDEYGLWPDFNNFDDVVSYYKNVPVKRVGPSFISNLNTKYKKRSGIPLYVTTDGLAPYEGIVFGQFILGQDFLGQATSKKMLVWPAISDVDYILPITFCQQITELDDDSDEPLMDVDDRIVLFYGGCADLYGVLKDKTEKEYYESKYIDKIKRMLIDNQEDDDYAQLDPTDSFDSINDALLMSSIYDDWD